MATKSVLTITILVLYRDGTQNIQLYIIGRSQYITILGLLVHEAVFNFFEDKMLIFKVS